MDNEKISALDEALYSYRHSHKTLWQIGRDYELYVGYRCTQNGFTVEYNGAQKGFHDGGVDIIAQKGNVTLLIQCKYWAKNKVVHENIIAQLAGTVKPYCAIHNISEEDVIPVLVTSTVVSNTAKYFAKANHIRIYENDQMGNYPPVKCDILDLPEGKKKVYRLPFDKNYDVTFKNTCGEHFLWSAKEAETLGYCRDDGQTIYPLPSNQYNNANKPATYGKTGISHHDIPMPQAKRPDISNDEKVSIDLNDEREHQVPEYTRKKIHIAPDIIFFLCLFLLTIIIAVVLETFNISADTIALYCDMLSGAGVLLLLLSFLLFFLGDEPKKILRISGAVVLGIGIALFIIS